LTMESAPTYTGTLALLATWVTTGMAEAMVLSIGEKIASTLPASELATCCTSEELVTVPSTTVKPFFLAYFFKSSTTAWELVSPELYSAPTVLISANSMIFSAETASEVPVTFLPGFSMLLTRPEPTGSVQAENTMGISLVSPTAAWAEGVAMATIKSYLLLANF